MEGYYPKSPSPVSEPVGQAEAAISAQLTAVKSESSWGLGGSLYSRIVQILLYTTALVMPLFYLPWSSGVLEYNKQVLLVVITAVGLVVWLLGVVVTGKLTIRSTPLDKGMLGLLVATIVSTVVSVARAKSIFGISVSLSSSLLSVAVLTVFYFLIVNVTQDRGRMLRNALSLGVALALLVGVCQMMSWNFLPGSFTNSRAFNTVGALNVLGVLAAVFLPLFAKSIARRNLFSGLVIPVGGVVLSLVVLAILNWWVLWAIALAGMLSIIAFDSLNATVLAQDYGGNRFTLARFVVPMVVVVLGAFLLLVNFNPASIKKDFPVEVAPSHSLSVQVVKGVLRQNLLVGVGPENFSIAFDRFGAGQLANTRLAELRFFDATSEFYTMLVQGGVLSLVALLVLLWCLVQVVARFGGALSESVARGAGALFAAESSGTLAAAVAMLVAFFLYPFNIVLWFSFAALLALAGLAVAGSQQRTVDIEERPLLSLTASLGFIVGLILVLSALYFTSVRYLADARYARALATDSPATAMEGLVRAIDMDGSNDRYLRDASQVALAMLREEINAKDTGDAQQRSSRIQNLVASSIQLAQRAAQVAPSEALNWANLGAVYQSMTGVVDDVERLAEDSYRKASELRPGDPTFDNRIGLMWLGRADLIASVLRQSSANAAELRKQREDSLGKAEEAFKRAIEKSPTFGLAIYYLGAVYDRLDRVPEAIVQLEKIAPYNANEPSLMFELGLLYLRASDKDKAQAAMRRAVLLAPQFANARWYLALLLEDAGDKDGAVVQLREIEKDNPDNAALKTKIQQLTAVPPVAPEGEVIDTEPLQ